MASQEDNRTDELLKLTHELIEIPSVSRNETAIADFVQAKLQIIEGLSTERVGDNLVARTERGLNKRLILGGHLDTVPHAPEFLPELKDGVASGPGAIDMKGGLAVMLALANETEKEIASTSEMDISFVFYVAEEIDIQYSGLRQLERERPDLLEADAAILLEPTGGIIEAGCQGTMKVLLRLKGKRSHTARAWKGVNAVHRLAPVLSAISNYEPRRPVIDGCEFIEALQVVSINGGVAGNVVPDLAEMVINVRFAPDKDSKTALNELAELISKASGELEIVDADMESKKDEVEADTLQIVDVAEPAMPSLDNLLLNDFVSQAKEVRAKLGWTDVAYFYQKGIGALNFGPGNPELSHTSNEKVSREELFGAYSALRNFIF